MATATMEMEHRRAEEEDEQQQHEQPAREVGRRVSRLAVEGGADSKLGVVAARAGGKNQPLADAAAARGRALPPPHAWLAIEDGGGAARRQQQQQQRDSDDDPADAGEKWARLLRSAGGAWGGARGPQRQRRSSFSVVRRERAAREAWLDRAWEMKRSWHERNGGAPDADTPVVVVVGKAAGSDEASPRAAGEGPHSQHHQFAAGAVGGGGVAMDVEEVRACRDLGLELPSDCTVEIQCYGLSGGSSPTHTVSSSGADSPCAVSSPGADPMDVKARLKVWAQAVALASTTHLTS